MKKAMSILISGIMSVAAIPFTAVNAEDNTELWEDFLKYDLCITDYDSLTEKEQELCHFIFDTETVYAVAPEPSARTFRATLPHFESHLHGR